MYRTHTCGELRLAHQGQEVRLCGWVQTTRLLGGLTFIDLRDHYGITQLMVSTAVLEQFGQHIGREFVLQAEGKVIERKSKNPQLPTGEIEIEVKKITLINASKTPPFTLLDESDGGEELRMKYRYLDLRRNPLQRNLKLRARLAILIRDYLNALAFNEIETPFLIKSTPEGARDFIIPSRMNPNEYYALPQSPQTFKQLLMIAGYDRYYQIVRCFRDEDLRADRQPEFTQLDCEMSFVTQEDVLRTFEGLVLHLIQKIKGIDLPNPIPRMTYADAMRDYGCDKPDLRFDMKIQNICVEKRPAHPSLILSEFPVFAAAESVLGLVVPQGMRYSRKDIDQLTEWVKRPQMGMQGLAYLKYDGEQVSGSIEKFFPQEKLHHLARFCQMQQGDLLLLLAGKETTTRKATGELRLEIARKEAWLDDSKMALLWVTDFPLFLYNEEAHSWDACHHPFTSPSDADLEKLDTPSAYGSITAQAYDCVLNGVEIGGGSIRIHKRDVQEKLFKILHLTEDEIQSKFGFILNAFDYGAPPHGGIAFGFDRLCALLAGTNSIREVIAFPKNNSGRDTMLDAPSAISDQELSELHIQNKPR